MSNSFMDEQRRRQRELVRVRAQKQAGLDESTPSVTEEKHKIETFTDFWFYYKFWVLGIIFAAVVLTVGVAQCAGREKYDQQVVLFSYNSFTTSEIDALETELEKYGVDVNGDGEVHIQILDCSYSSNELLDQINAKRSKLTANIASNGQALLFITDAESVKYFDDLFDKRFFVNNGLPEDDGNSLMLPQSMYDAVNAQTPEGFSLPEGLRISERIADETTMVGKAKGAKENIAAAKELIKNMQK